MERSNLCILGISSFLVLIWILSLLGFGACRVLHDKPRFLENIFCKKNYQGHTFALRIPLELDEDGLASLKLEHLSCSCLLAQAPHDEDLQEAPPYTNMGETSSPIHQ